MRRTGRGQGAIRPTESVADTTEINAISCFKNLGHRQAATFYQLFPTRVVAVRRLPDRPPFIEMGGGRSRPAAGVPPFPCRPGLTLREVRAGSCGGYLPTHHPNSLGGTMNDLLAANDDPFQLDVQIVTEGPVAAALLADTDDGCDTQKNGDC